MYNIALEEKKTFLASEVDSQTVWIFKYKLPFRQSCCEVVLFSRLNVPSSINEEQDNFLKSTVVKLKHPATRQVNFHKIKNKMWRYQYCLFLLTGG